MDFEFFANVIQNASGLIQSSIKVYSGNSLLVNKNGNPAFCQVLTVDDRNTLAMEQSIQITSTLFSVIFVNDSPPSTTLPFFVSWDNGTNKTQVNFVRYTERLGYFEILLSGS